MASFRSSLFFGSGCLHFLGEVIIIFWGLGRLYFWVRLSSFFASLFLVWVILIFWVRLSSCAWTWGDKIAHMMWPKVLQSMISYCGSIWPQCHTVHRYALHMHQHTPVHSTQYTVPGRTESPNLEYWAIKIREKKKQDMQTGIWFGGVA